MSFDPYAPPATESSTTGDLPFRRIAVASLAACAVVGPVVGAAEALQDAFALSHFGGIEWVPRVVALAALRAHAATGALIVTTLAGVAVAHRAAQKRAPGGGHVALVGVAVLAAHLVLCVAILSGGALALRVAYAIPFAVFLDFRGSVTWGDVASGLGFTVVSALVATALLPPLLRIAAASRWPLVGKLVVGWIGAQATCFVLGSAIAALVAR